MIITNLSLLTDLYQFTMMNGYYQKGIGGKLATFDLFFRRLPFSGGFCIAAGLEEAIEYLENLNFSDEEISYLKSLKLFSTDFLNWLKSFRFSGTIHAIPEGTAVFPNEPLVRVTGPLIEAQFLETFFLNVINFQTLIATKSARIYEASGRSPVVEFGLRRAHGPNGACTATRAAFIGGCEGTSNVLAAMNLGIPARGTMAHSWVMSYPDELSAFRAYAQVYPDSSIFLVDTFDTLKEGIPNAIIVGKEMQAKGKNLKGIRLDSGDLAYLSVEARKLLDSNGLSQVKIVASNDLDEGIIETLRHQGARIDVWGVGTKLITATPESALGGVYKMVAMEGDDGRIIPKIKLSQNIEKTTIPGRKGLFRIFDEQGMMVSDVMALEEEKFPDLVPTVLHHPQVEYKLSRLEACHTFENLLEEVFHEGKRTKPKSELSSIQKRTINQLNALHPTHRRLANPHTYKVGLTPKLWELRQELIRKNIEK